ncbi:MAG: hypothetical protein HN348_36795 [Proteobacteria bacterium]|nr:hypothetical protein [Pseudomonadota bacterium]
MNLALGIAVYGAIEWCMEQRIDGVEADEEEVLRIFSADWYAETAMDDIEYGKKTPAQTWALGTSLVQLFVDHHQVEPTALEQKFEVALLCPAVAVMQLVMASAWPSTSRQAT